MPLRTIVDQCITTIEFNKQGINVFIFFNEVFYFYFLDLVDSSCNLVLCLILDYNLIG